MDQQSVWKSSCNRYYCSEFCAESESVDFVQAHNSPDITASRYERLQRLLPYMENLRHFTRPGAHVAISDDYKINASLTQKAGSESGTIAA
jgi:hypothetical protein